MGGGTCEENKKLFQFSPVFVSPTIPKPPRHPFDEPANMWMKAKDQEMQELDEALGISVARHGNSTPERGRDGSIRTEDISEFAEPVFKRLPSEPTVPRVPAPTGAYQRPYGNRAGA